MRTIFRIGVCVCFAFVLPLAAFAGSWRVSQDGSGDFRTIKGAMDAASHGDVILVASGLYEEPVALRDGVTVIGAGPQQTVVRYTYAFDPVLVIEHVSSGRIEGMTIERAASILEGPAVLVTSGSAVLAYCAVSGGVGPGIDVVGVASNLTLESVTVLENDGPGMTIRAGARASLRDGHVTANEGAGVWVGEGGRIEVHASRFSSNGGAGILLESDAIASLDDCEIREHASSGLRVADEATVEGVDLVFAENAESAIRLTEHAVGTFDGVRIDGGGDGVLCEGDASCVVLEGRVASVNGVGLQAEDRATIRARACEVVGSGRDGVVFASAGACSLLHSTVARSVGDGVRISGETVQVEHCILAYNAAAGLRVEDAVSAAGVHVFSHNCVWGNGTDYEGTTRRPSDVAAAPEFADLEAGDVSLRPDSPCIEAGAGWTTLGAHGDPSSARVVTIDILSSTSRGWFGETWRADLRLSGLPVAVDAFDVGFCYAEAGVTLDVESAVFGGFGRRVTATGTIETTWRYGSLESATLLGGFAGVLAGTESWGSAWGLASLDGGAIRASLRLAANWPSSHAASRLKLAFALSQWELSASIAAIDTTLTELDLSVSQGIRGSRLRLEERLQLLPDRIATATVHWGGDGWNWTGVVELGEEAWRVRLAVADRGFSIAGKVRFAGADFSEGSVSAAVSLGSIRLSGELALSAESGPRMVIGLAFDPTAWLRRPANEPPLPAFTAVPLDPEAGTPIRFDAAGSVDSDGEIRDVWWDFGDGAVAEGVSVDHAYAAAGTYAVALTVSDDRGAASSLTLPVTVWPADTSPIASFIALAASPGGIRLPRAPRAGDVVLLDASESSDADGGVVEYSWDFQSDGVVDLVSSDPVVTAPPLAAGPHPVTLRVVDDTSRTDAVMHVVLVDQAEPPRAVFSFTPPTPAIQDPVYFSDRSVDSDGSVVAWVWDFGDGQSSRDASPVHRFTSEGEYAVTLSVRDSDGLEAEQTRTVVVSAVPEVVPVDEVWAVIMGISDYIQVKDLQYGRDDGVALCRWLVESGVPKDHIRLLLDTEEPVLGLEGVVPRRATLVEVREALGWLRRVAGEDDLVLVSFSGHGFQGDDDNGDEKDGVDEFFVLVDTSSAAPEDTALRDDEFGRFLDRLNSTHVLVLFDGCYSGGLSRSLPSSKRPIGERPDLFSDFSLEGRLVLSAAAESQEAFESPELGHGVFTFYVIEGLRGAADLNADLRVTAWELYEYVAASVSERVRRERGAVQEPQLSGEGEVRVLLATASRPPLAAFSYGPEIPYAGAPVRFVDQSRIDRGPATYAWCFGDGATSSEVSPSHAYESPGDYGVELRVTDARGDSASRTARIRVAPAGRVISVDDPTGAVLISLGEENGVRTGDRFDVPEAPCQLQVVELIGGDAAACRLLTGELPTVGAVVRSVSPEDPALTPPVPG